MSVPLFAQRGYEAVSMREIAAAVGIQAPALYYHFPDKQSLYLAVMDYAFTDQLKRPTDALTGDGPPFARLQRFVATLVEELANNPICSCCYSGNGSTATKCAGNYWSTCCSPHLCSL